MVCDTCRCYADYDTHRTRSNNRYVAHEKEGTLYRVNPGVALVDVRVRTTYILNNRSLLDTYILCVQTTFLKFHLFWLVSYLYSVHICHSKNRLKDSHPK